MQLIISLVPLIISLAPLIAILAVWDLIWKGMALWKSAQRKEKSWFVALLIVNSAGILPLIYLISKGDILGNKKR